MQIKLILAESFQDAFKSSFVKSKTLDIACAFVSETGAKFLADISKGSPVQVRLRLLLLRLLFLRKPKKKRSR